MQVDEGLCCCEGERYQQTTTTCRLQQPLVLERTGGYLNSNQAAKAQDEVWRCLRALDKLSFMFLHI